MNKIEEEEDYTIIDSSDSGTIYNIKNIKQKNSFNYWQTLKPVKEIWLILKFSEQKNIHLIEIKNYGTQSIQMDVYNKDKDGDKSEKVECVPLTILIPKEKLNQHNEKFGVKQLMPELNGKKFQYVKVRLINKFHDEFPCQLGLTYLVFISSSSSSSNNNGDQQNECIINSQKLNLTKITQVGGTNEINKNYQQQQQGDASGMFRYSQDKLEVENNGQFTLQERLSKLIELEETEAKQTPPKKLEISQIEVKQINFTKNYYAQKQQQQTIEDSFSKKTNKNQEQKHINNNNNVKKYNKRNEQFEMQLEQALAESKKEFEMQQQQYDDFEEDIITSKEHSKQSNKTINLSRNNSSNNNNNSSIGYNWYNTLDFYRNLLQETRQIYDVSACNDESDQKFFNDYIGLNDQEQ